MNDDPQDANAPTLTMRNRIFCALLSAILGAMGTNALIGAPGGLWVGVPAVALGILAAVAAVRGGSHRWYRAII